MKKIIILLFIIAVISTNSAYGHKLIMHDNAHKTLDKSLQITDHKTSWAIYENIGQSEKRFYSFEAEAGDSFHASIVIPSIPGLETYSPTLVLINGSYLNEDIPILDSHAVVEKAMYNGEFPGEKFYEPFGQVTYWERQEINTILTTEGKYFVMVFDEMEQEGKYSLAIGTIEDFSAEDLFVTLPTSWLQTKFFVEDYSSIAIFALVIIGVTSTIIAIIFRKKMQKKNY